MTTAPDTPTLGKVFDWLADRYERQTRWLSGGWYGRWLDAVADLVAAEHPDRILDVGCGSGALLERLAQRCPHAALYAVDCSPRMADLTRRRVPQARVVVCPLAEAREHLERPSDVVTMTFVLREQADPPETLSLAYELLAPGGQLVILETHRPRGPSGYVFDTYLHRAVPALARAWLTRDWPDPHGTPPYAWLATTQMRWGDGRHLGDWLDHAGFHEIVHHRPDQDVVLCTSARRADRSSAPPGSESNR